MKNLYIVVCLSVFWILAGCSDVTKNTQNVTLPPETAGMWRTAEGEPKANLAIELSTEGKVLSAVITPGEVRVFPRKTTRVEVQDGKFATYKVGPCSVFYSPQMRELTVDIDVKHLRIPFPEDVLEGNVRHVFTGTVNEEGTVWETTWLEFFDYGPRFPMDPNAIGEPLTFYKIDPADSNSVQ